MLHFSWTFRIYNFVIVFFVSEWTEPLKKVLLENHPFHVPILARLKSKRRWLELAYKMHRESQHHQPIYKVVDNSCRFSSSKILANVDFFYKKTLSLHSGISFQYTDFWRKIPFLHRFFQLSLHEHCRDFYNSPRRIKWHKNYQIWNKLWVIETKTWTFFQKIFWILPSF